MAAESSRVELRLSNDPLLLGAVAGAVEHFAQRAGLDTAGQTDLIAAAEEACRDTFKLLPGNAAMLGVIVQDFPDRVEITIEHQGEALPTAGLDTFALLGAEGAAPGELTGLALLARVDRVQYQTEGGTSRMTLIKYVHRSPAKP